MGQERKRFYPLLECRGKGAHRPITAEHHSVPPKALDDVLDKRTEIVRRPMFRVGIGHQAGNLAGHIRQLGNLADMLSPGVHDFFFHLRHPAMVEHEADTGTTLDKIDSKEQLAGKHAEIKALKFWS